MGAVFYNPRGYEATLDEGGNSCSVVVRGYQSGKSFVERGGPAHPEDRVLARFTIPRFDIQTATDQPNVRDTFIDSLADRRDLLGATMFRHKPADDAERRLFAAAFDAAQRIRAKMLVLGCDTLLFTLAPSAFSIVDCYARDAHGFWLMNVEVPAPQAGFGGAGAPVRSSQSLPLAAYILERGGYIPATASVHLGVWDLSATGAKFTEIPNDRAAARDIIIDHLCDTPF